MKTSNFKQNDYICPLFHYLKTQFIKHESTDLKFYINRMKKLFPLITILVGHTLFAQIIPPGLGNATNIANWFAVGIKQDLNSNNGKGWESSTSVGIGSMSSPNNHNPLEKMAIIVLNQEFTNRFHDDWEYSLAFSYRRQNQYSDTEPYEKEDPPFKQEFRLYGKFSYILKTDFVEITPTVRQEVQKYFTPDFGSPSETLRLRSRFRLKFMFPITQDNQHRILLFSEQLFSTSYLHEQKEWTNFGYKDSRFSIYYSLSPKKIPWTFNIGYMNHLIGTKKPTSSHSIGVDMIWKNPFGN